MLNSTFKCVEERPAHLHAKPFSVDAILAHSRDRLLVFAMTAERASEERNRIIIPDIQDVSIAAAGSPRSNTQDLFLVNWTCTRSS